MSPTAKFSAVLVSTTVFVMFLLIAYAGPLLTRGGIDYPIFLAISALVTSAGLYRLLALGLRWLMERWEWLRSVVLGPSYMHGTWIGWFRGHTGELRYMIEHFVQD